MLENQQFTVNFINHPPVKINDFHIIKTYINELK